jgi:hypothetical protein
MYSGKPAASIVVHDVVAENHLEQPGGRRRLNDAGLRAVNATAERIAGLVDELLGRQWDRTDGTFVEGSSITAGAHEPAAKEATCACGSGIPVKTVDLNGQAVTLTALPLLFKQFHQAGKAPSEAVARELLETTKIYNVVPAELESDYLAMLLREYTAFCNEAGA